MSDSVPEQSTLGQMLRIVAHDLRNPLAVIISNLGYLQSTLPGASDDVKETLADTLTSCQDLKHVVENVDLLGHLLKGMTGGGTGFTILDATIEVTRACQPLAASHGVDLHANFDALDAGLRCAGERINFERAFANLVRNSIQHAPAGTAVLVDGLVEGARCLLRVTDQGTSFEAPWDQLAFTARGQIEGKSAGLGRYGRGLGLYCSQAAAAALRATVSAHSSDGVGNQFELSVPISD